MSNMKKIDLNKYEIIFWDFDGVIKDSVKIKTETYMELFAEEGQVFTEKVRMHHIENAGISRFVKIPLYLQWINKNSEENVIKYLNIFKQMVLDNVIYSDWVLGVQEFILNNSELKSFYIVTGTPQEEIEFILDELNISDKFVGVYGSPASKIDIISDIIKSKKIELHKCIMIGDAMVDYESARINNIEFLLRDHNENKDVFSKYEGFRIKNFLF